MILFLCAAILGNGHAVGTHIPGDRSLLLNIGDVKRQPGDAMTERPFQVLSNGLSSVDGFVVRRQVDRVFGVRRNHSVQLSRIPMSSPIIANPADRSSCIDDSALPSGGGYPSSSLLERFFTFDGMTRLPQTSFTEQS